MEVGLGTILIGGVFQGIFLAPAKAMRGWAWENYWLIFSCSAYLICPWLLAFITVPRLLEVYAGIPVGMLGVVALFGVAWGLGALTFGLGVEAVGLALGYAVIVGVAAIGGTIVPLLVQPTVLSRPIVMATTAALVLMLVGVAICSSAGTWKERPAAGVGSKSYLRGLLICVASGLLSACANFGFTFGAPIARRAQELGASDALASSALWCVLATPVFLCNAVYTIRRLVRNGSTGQFRSNWAWNASLGIVMGIFWLAGMAAYGAGARRLGPLGPSFGWAMLMSTMVLVANTVGILTGEWTAAPAAAKRQLRYGIGILLAAIGSLGYANHLRSL